MSAIAGSQTETNGVNPKLNGRIVWTGPLYKRMVTMLWNSMHAQITK